MTTIAAATFAGVHAIAADGRAVAGSLVVTEDAVKLFALGAGAVVRGVVVRGVVVAASGDLRTLNLVSKLPAAHESSPACLAAQLKELFDAQGYAPQAGDEQAGTAPCWTQEFFRMDDSGISWIGQDLSVSPVREGFPQALGSGTELAIGAMEALTDLDMSARQVVVAALRSSMKRDAGTGGKIMLALRGTENFGPERIS